MTDFSTSDPEGLRRLGVDPAAVGRAAASVAACLHAGGKVLSFGNGGSAADAQHFAAELVGRFEVERPALPAVALTTDTSALTAIGNDYGFDSVFARQVEALGSPGDVVLAISTSGTSANVLAAVERARSIGLRAIGMTGPGGALLGELSDVLIAVDADSTAAVQEGHLAVEHEICRQLDRVLSQRGRRAEPGPGSTIELPQLLELREMWGLAGWTVAWSSGCFDLVHAGHLRSLAAARALGDVLVVGVNSDDSVSRLKGPDRPFVPVAERAELLAALRFVDYVVSFDQDTPEEILAAVRPDVHTKGAEYAPPDGRPIPERAVVEGYGGRVEFLPLLVGRSTTDIVERIRRTR